MKFQEWKEKAERAYGIADKIRQSRYARAKKTAKAAGLDISALHNAMVGLEYGKPWVEVNYKLARRAKYILEHQFDGHEIASKYVNRLWGKIEFPSQVS